MGRESPTLLQLRIIRMPGFPRAQSFALDELVPGINVLYGPNEIGKTTVADAIGMLLHGRPGGGREELEALVGIGEDCRDVVYINGGFDPEPPHRLPADHTRYRLSLHELLQAGDPNRSFAELVLRESAGGCDVRGAGEALGFREAPPSTNIGEYTRYRTCRNRLKEARSSAEDPRRLEDELQGLQSEKREVQRESETADALEVALEYAGHSSGLNSLRSELDALPDPLESMTGDEADRLKALRKECKALERELEEAEGTLADAQREMERTGLSGAVPRKLLKELGGKVEAMKQISRDIDSLQRRLGGLEGKLRETEKTLGDTVDPAALGRVDVALVDRAGKVARRLAGLHASEEELRAVTRIQSGDSPEVDADELRDAGRALRRWLASPEPRRSGRRTLDLAGAALAVVAGMGGIALTIFGKTGWPAAVVGAAALAAGLILVSGFLTGRPETDNRPVYRGEFERAGVEPPRSWSRDGVSDRLDELENSLAGARLAERCRSSRERIEREIAKLRDGLEDEAGRLSEQVGAPITGNGEGFLSLVANLNRWQEVRADKIGVEGELEEARKQYLELAHEVSEALVPYGFDSSEDLQALNAAVGDLSERADTYRRGMDRRENAEKDRARAEDRMKAKEGEMADLFERLGLKDGDEAGLRRLCGQVEKYNSLREEASKASTLAEASLRRLKDMPGCEPKMADLDEATLELRLGELDGCGSRLKELNEEIPTLQERIRQAKQSHEIEDALGSLDGARHDLALRLEEHAGKMAGWAVAETLMEATRDSSRPKVFHRAAELLADFTRGRCELRFDEGGSPEFRARDTVHRTTKGLDELSSGTRVQLLMAVRLAFVEREERGARLPVVFDEALANSDRARAEATIGAMIDTARSGRQVFYLTAQEDEVSKWKAALEGCDDPPEHRFIDLARVRKLQDARRAPALQPVPVDALAVPPPEGRGHAAYGSLLEVPPFDPSAETGAAHIWYVVDDPDTLYDLLHSRGIQRVGQLRSLARLAGAGDGLFPSAEARDRALALAEALDAYRLACMEGRGRRVDRSVLEDADGVTSTMLDRVAKKARECGGDARRLLDALENGEVPGFRADKRRQLQSYLGSGGYLPATEPLRPDEIRVRVLRSVRKRIEDGTLDPDDVYALLKRAAASSGS